MIPACFHFLRYDTIPFREVIFLSEELQTPVTPRPKKKKKKKLKGKAAKKRMPQSERLEKAQKWLANYSGDDVVKAYRKKFGNTLIQADDLNTRIEGAEYDFSINAGWSFGASGDWYWDESETTAYWVSWIDRHGAFKFKMTCFE